MRGASSFLVFLAALGAPGLLAERAVAQDTQQPQSRGTVVIVADVAADTTENAKVRAGAYEAARERGYEPKPKMDVTAAATRAGAIQAGTISTEPDKVGALRNALGVTMLLRISKEWTGGGNTGVRITLASDKGTQSRVVQAPSANARDTVAAAVTDMLDEVAPPPPKPEPEPEPEPQQDWQVVAAGRTPPPNELPTAAEDPVLRRRAWEDRSGPRFMYHAKANLVGMAQTSFFFSDQRPPVIQMPMAAQGPRPGCNDGVTDCGNGELLGIGGGLGFRLGIFYLPLPDPSTQHGSFVGFGLGTGVDANLIFSKEPSGYVYSGLINQNAVNKAEDFDHFGRFALFVPVDVGIFFGVGDYHASTQWRGIVLGIAYAPTFVFYQDIGSRDSDNTGPRDATGTQFNYAGAELSLDITKLTIEDDPAKNDMQIRIAATFLPPIESDFPMFGMASVGAVWY